VTRIGFRKADGLEAPGGHAVEPVALGDLDLHKIMLLRLVEILDLVGLSAQLVLYLQARHPEVAVQTKDSEATGGF
jgi:hypothetical protein